MGIVNYKMYFEKERVYAWYIQIDDINQSQALIGNNDEHLKAIEDSFDVVIHARGQEIAVKGEKIEHVEKPN